MPDFEGCDHCKWKGDRNKTIHKDSNVTIRTGPVANCLMSIANDHGKKNTTKDAIEHLLKTFEAISDLRLPSEMTIKAIQLHHTNTSRHAKYSGKEHLHAWIEFHQPSDTSFWERIGANSSGIDADIPEGARHTGLSPVPYPDDIACSYEGNALGSKAAGMLAMQLKSHCRNGGVRFIDGEANSYYRITFNNGGVDGFRLVMSTPKPS